MRNYEKPVVLINEELAEGVYAASGTMNEDFVCKPDDTRPGDNIHHIQIDDKCHNGRDQFITITFDPSCNIDKNSVWWGGNCSDVNIFGNCITYIRRGDRGNGCGDFRVKDCNGRDVRVRHVKVERCR